MYINLFLGHFHLSLAKKFENSPKLRLSIVFGGKLEIAKIGGSPRGWKGATCFKTFQLTP